MIDVLLAIIDRLIQLKSHRDDRLIELFSKLLEPTFNDLLIVHRDYMQLFEKTKSLLPELDVVNVFYVYDHSQGVNTWLLFQNAAQARKYAAELENSDAEIRTMRMEITHWVDLDYTGTLSVGFSSQTNAQNYCEANGIEYSRIRKAEIVRTPDKDFASLKDAMNHVVQARLQFEPVRVQLGKLSQQMSNMKLSNEADKFVGDVISYFPVGTFRTDRRGSGATNIVGVFETYFHDDNSYNAHSAKKCIGDVDYLINTMETDYRQKWAKVCESFAELKISVIGRI